MIDLYYWPTPNGHKVTLLLEELDEVGHGLDFTIKPVNIGAGDQFKSEFLAISPNNKMPAIVDHAPAKGGEPVSVFESGAILLYLAEKTGQFLPPDMRGWVRTMEWLFWQMGGLGPMTGQMGHFNVYAPEPVPYAIERYNNEVDRLHGVLDQQLGKSRFVAGDEYTIADMAIYPWIKVYDKRLPDLDKFPNIKRWHALVAARPATVRAYQWGPKVNPSAGQPLSEEERKQLFNQTSNQGPKHA